MTKKDLIRTVPGADPQIVEPLADAVLSFWDALDAGEPAEVIVYREGKPSERMSYSYQKRMMNRNFDVAGMFALILNLAEQDMGLLNIKAGDKSWQF